MSAPFLESLLPYQYFDLLLKIGSIKRSEKWNRDTIERMQRKRLESLLHHVIEHSPFYRRLYVKHGISQTDIPDLQLSDLPIIDKHIMMEHYDEFVCDRNLNKADLTAFISDPVNLGRKYQNRYQVIHTSGSTGEVGLFVYDIQSWNTIKALAMTRVSKAKINPFDKIRLAFIGATDGHYAGVSLSSDAPKLFYEFLELSVNQPVKPELDELQHFDPTALGGYSSSIYMLALEQLRGHLDIHPERIVCSADALTDRMKTAIADAFGVAPVNFYAASESLCMAAECDRHEGLHLFEDWHCYELVDALHQPMQGKGPGSLLLTTLHNYAQPLIRYQMNDEIILSDEPCRCGSAYRRIEKVSGRSEEFLWFTSPEGEKEFIHPVQIVEFFVSGLEKMQLKQTKPKHLHLQIVTEAEDDTVLKAALKRMHEILAEKKLDRYVTVSAEVVEDIPLDPITGKFKMVIPYKG